MPRHDHSRLTPATVLSQPLRISDLASSVQAPSCRSHTGDPMKSSMILGACVLGAAMTAYLGTRGGQAAPALPTATMPPHVTVRATEAPGETETPVPSRALSPVASPSPTATPTRVVRIAARDLFPNGPPAPPQSAPPVPPPFPTATTVVMSTPPRPPISTPTAPPIATPPPLPPLPPVPSPTPASEFPTPPPLPTLSPRGPGNEVPTPPPLPTLPH